MNNEQANELKKALNSYYGNEFEKTPDNKKEVSISLKFENYEELGRLIHGVNKALNIIGDSMLHEMNPQIQGSEYGLAIQELSELNQRLTTYSLFTGLDYATDLIK